MNRARHPLKRGFRPRLEWKRVRCRHTGDAREYWIPVTSVSNCAWNNTYARHYVKKHVSASILVNAVAYGLVKVNNGERKWMCNSSYIHSSLILLFLLSVSWMLIKQQHLCSFNTNLLDLIYTGKTLHLRIQFLYLNTVIPVYFILYLCSIIISYGCNLFFSADLLTYKLYIILFFSPNRDNQIIWWFFYIYIYLFFYFFYISQYIL